MLGKLNFLIKPIRVRLAHKLPAPSIPLCLEKLSTCGFTPRHIVDVGAYRGDFARDCLAVWPKAKISCFEPQTDIADALERLLQGYPTQIDVFDCLLGARD